jgi:excisionase family DNA binding protein
MRAAQTEGYELSIVREVEAILRLSPPTVYRLIASGELPAARVGKALRIYRSELEAVLQRPANARTGTAARELAFAHARYTTTEGQL